MVDTFQALDKAKEACFCPFQDLEGTLILDMVVECHIPLVPSHDDMVLQGRQVEDKIDKAEDNNKDKDNSSLSLDLRLEVDDFLKKVKDRCYTNLLKKITAIASG